MNEEKDSSIASKEYISRKFVPATNSQQTEIELPLIVLVTGNLQGYAQEMPIENRQVVSVNKNNFAPVMKESGLHLDFTVKNKLDRAASNDLAVTLDVESLDDFTPDKVARQVPELCKLLKLRELLVALKSKKSRKQLLLYKDLIKPIN